MRLPLKYTSAGSGSKREETFYPESIATVPDKFKTDGIQFKVLTPLFYSSVVRFAHVSEFIYSEELRHDDKQRTFWTSDPRKLIQLLGEKQIVESSRSNPHADNWWSQVHWAILRLLRRSPQHSVLKEVPQRPESLGFPAYHDIRSFRLSALDQFVLSSCKRSQAEEYRTAVSTLLLSDYITFGNPELIDAFDWCIRLLFCYVFVDTMVDWVHTLFSPCIFMRVSDTLLSSNLIHIWWLVKSML